MRVENCLASRKYVRRRRERDQTSPVPHSAVPRSADPIMLTTFLLLAAPPSPTSYVNVLFQLISHSDQVAYLEISCRTAQQNRERSCRPNWHSSIPPTTVSMMEAMVCGLFLEAKRMSSPTQLSLSLPAPFRIGAIKHVRKSSQKKPQKDSKLTGQHAGEKKEIEKRYKKTF